MGEIFAKESALQPLEFTGERNTPSTVGQVQLEHLHRYFFARVLCAEKTVLDVASGEGYGSSYLAQVAKTVVGVEIDLECVSHASSAYQRPNLRFQQGDATQLRFPDASFDVVVSFETIEHLVNQEEFISEVGRVLKPDGVLILSSPNRDIYSPLGGTANPFHRKELERAELDGLLRPRFSAIEYYGQRSLCGSVLRRDSDRADGFMIFERRDDVRFEISEGLARPVYFIAVASRGIRPQSFDSVYIDSNDVDLPIRLAKNAQANADALLSAQANELRLQDELKALREAHQNELMLEIQTSESLRSKLETDYEKLEADYKKAVNELDGARGELGSLREQVTLLASELEQARSKIAAADSQPSGRQSETWTPSRYAELSVSHWRKETPEQEARRRQAENKLLRL